MASTADHLAARGDTDLLQRLIAAAEQAGIDGAQSWAEANVGRLISAPVAGAQTIADVHAYAAGQRQVALNALPPRPGLDPAAVTDAHLAAAVAAVRSA